MEKHNTCYTEQCTLQFITCTGPNLNQPEKVVQYEYRLYKAKLDSTPNELSPSSEIYMVITLHCISTELNRPIS